MRILHAHNNYSPQGGADVFYHEVGSMLEDNGHDAAYSSAGRITCPTIPFLRLAALPRPMWCRRSDATIYARLRNIYEKVLK